MHDDKKFDTYNKPYSNMATCIKCHETRNHIANQLTKAFFKQLASNIIQANMIPKQLKSCCEPRPTKNRVQIFSFSAKANWFMAIRFLDGDA